MLLDNRYTELTKAIIGCAMRVHTELGSGFPEVIYQRSLAVELKQANLKFQGEINLPVFYKQINIGSRRADFLVEEHVLVELKAVNEITEAHHAQIINYLKAYRLEVALLINFGEASLKFKRFLHNPPH
ncbi:GxxExxY protein [Hymenobacter actinosclerus]|uniref:GxxExxY protein n=1 Tax=Hymenobacter actinosclerus TaxID=82805 RepID=A0A1I0EKQ3_9BACT|nr:GxxExxY protein [Hymenobacter actinosclerus]SET45552.1 GxxExxY protein [Hymenobacter actinosclerus]